MLRVALVIYLRHVDIFRLDGIVVILNENQ